MSDLTFSLKTLQHIPITHDIRCKFTLNSKLTCSGPHLSPWPCFPLSGHMAAMLASPLFFRHTRPVSTLGSLCYLFLGQAGCPALEWHRLSHVHHSPFPFPPGYPDFTSSLTGGMALSPAQRTVGRGPKHPPAGFSVLSPSPTCWLDREHPEEDSGPVRWLAHKTEGDSVPASAHGRPR